MKRRDVSSSFHFIFYAEQVRTWSRAGTAIRFVVGEKRDVGLGWPGWLGVSQGSFRKNFSTFSYSRGEASCWRKLRIEWNQRGWQTCTEFWQKKDFVLSELGMTLQRLRAVTFSWPYIIDLITYAHPAPQTIESYAAMLWPFNELTWIAVVLCLLISSVIIQLFGVSSRRKIEWNEIR